jgi:hypothetical protein
MWSQKRRKAMSQPHQAALPSITQSVQVVEFAFTSNLVIYTGQSHLILATEAKA